MGLAPARTRVKSRAGHELTRAEIEAWEEIACESARLAAAMIRVNLGQVAGVGLKTSPTDVVTQTDIDSEQLIRARLLEATPDAGIIGEEGDHLAPAAPLQWIIDPLDGTVNFTYGIPLFAVSIAAAYEGTLVAGAVIDVLRGELFSAGLGTGARCDGRTISTSVCDSLAGALVTTGFSYRAELRRVQGDVVGRLLPDVRDIRCFGSAALQMCWLADGRIDAYYERDTKIWDYAAGALICTEAGAIVELQCPENDGLVCAAPAGLFEQLRPRVDR